jgi:hypothetical protein
MVKAKLEVEPGRLTLENVKLKDGPFRRSIFLRNTSAEPMWIERLTANIPAIALSETSCELGPGERREIICTYTPVKPGRDDGYIAVQQSSGDRKVKYIPILVRVTE